MLKNLLTIVMLFAGSTITANTDLPAVSGPLKIGWAEADITPPEAVVIRGQFHARVSEGVKDPLTATALALESGADESNNRVVMVSCDLVSISECIRNGVEQYLRVKLPELPMEAVIMFATHTHTGPDHYIRPRFRPDAEPSENPYGVALPVMPAAEYVAFASRRIANAIIEAWNQRSPGGIGYGLGHAVVGRNRIMAYRDGRSRMYGRTDDPQFSHVEGYEDASVNFLTTYTQDGKLSGVVINLASPAQAESLAWLLSADFYHEVREEMRKRFGEDLFILPQNSAAGDQDSRPPLDRRAEDRMTRLAGYQGSERDRWRRELAVRIASAAERVLPLIEGDIDWNPAFAYHFETVSLPRRLLSQADVDAALERSRPHRKRFLEMKADLKHIPMAEREDRWYVDISRAYRRSVRGQNVARRFEAQQNDESFAVDLHALRLGDVAFVTNPFELYLDYGMRIKGRSPAMQTFIVQLAGPGSYLPTARSIEGGAYGAVPESTEVGVEGGQKLVEWSVDILNQFWHSESKSD